MSKQKAPEKAVEEKPKPKPITEAEMAVSQNHKEIVNQLNNHFNGNEKEKKTGLKNVETAFGNLVEANKKAKA